LAAGKKKKGECRRLQKAPDVLLSASPFFVFTALKRAKRRKDGSPLT
jgi:hypothetical protein